MKNNTQYLKIYFRLVDGIGDYKTIIENRFPNVKIKDYTKKDYELFQDRIGTKGNTNSIFNNKAVEVIKHFFKH
jgi:hypothetical protein